jgi:anti-sigma factor RsiW
MSNDVTACLSIGELSDYWTTDVSPDEAERIESHVFACAACTELLAEADRLRRSIGAAARAGFQAFVTDSLLNQLARDGVRVRSYVMDAGGSVQCAVWDQDEILVTRLRADFSGVTAVDAVMQLDTGEEWSRASDIPVPEGTREVIMALPAALVRRAPDVPMRLSLRSSSASPGEAALAEYTFDHRGAHTRRD